MNETDPTHEQFAAQVQAKAVSFPYPPTPDIAGRVRRRLEPQRPRRVRLAWALVALLLVAGLLAVPRVRAAVVAMIRAGAITIFVGEPTPIPTATSGPAGAAQTTLAERLATIAEPLTLAEAQERFDDELQLPSLLGPPDEVWLHEGSGYAAVISLWRAAADPAEIRYSFYQIDAVDYAYKGAERLEQLSLDGRPAFWIEGPHVFQLQDGRLEPWLIVPGSVLVWWAEDGTYRLEGAASLAEAVRIANSLTAVNR